MSLSDGHDRDTTHRSTEDVDPDVHEDDENTPLLAREEGANAQHEDRSLPRASAVSSLLRSIRGPGSGQKNIRKRWPSLLALAILCIVIFVILVLGFVAPQVAKEYASEAAQFEPTRLSIDSYTDTGVLARVEGFFEMDASKVDKKSVRDLGRFGTRIAKYVEIGQTNVQVSIPAYDGLVLGTAMIPSIVVSIVNGRKTNLDVLVNLEPGPQEGLRQIANDWVDGRIREYVMEAKAHVPLKSGILSLGKQFISQTVSLDGKYAYLGERSHKKHPS